MFRMTEYLSDDGLLGDGDGDGEDGVRARRRRVHLGRRRRPAQRPLLQDPHHLLLVLDHDLLQALGTDRYGKMSGFYVTQWSLSH